MAEFNVIDIPSILTREVRTYDEHRNQVLDDGTFQRKSALAGFVFAEHLMRHGFLNAGLQVNRKNDLVLKWSDLNDFGKKYVRLEFDNWLRSIDDVRISEKEMIEKLERRYLKHSR